MHSISAKVWLSLAAGFVFLFSCSREGPEPLWEAQSTYGKDYKGGLHPVYIKLKEAVDNASRIRWSSRYARIGGRNQEINSKGQITADTVFLYWETPPPPFIKLDSTQIKNDSTVSWKIDSTYYYRDTIFAIVDNAQESLPIVIEVKNILPRIKSLTVGDISQPGDSLLTIAANLGDKLKISLELEKEFKTPFNSAFHPIVTMPSLMGNPKLISVSEKDSVFVYEWAVPNEEISDSSAYLKIEDSGGYGERLYKVHLVVYTECGSVWVTAEKELVKYSPNGTEVARISDKFSSISDIYVNSKNGKLFVADESKNSFFIFDRYGSQLNEDKSSFKSPSGIAVDLDGNYVWVADIKASSSMPSSFSAISEVEARLRRFMLMSDELSPTSAVYEMSGPIKGLSINQFQSDLVWFAIPKSDTVGFTRDPKPKFMPNTWNRPSMISHDPSNGTAWVADSSRIVAIDTSGNVLANISGFIFVSSVSASKGNVWASDILSGKVYLFEGPFKGSAKDKNLTVMNGNVISGFIAPISVSTYTADGGAWVIDKEAGRAVRLDSLGNIIASGTGLKQPILGKTLQKVE
jgi:DNA-binding beta-propeller fold protein YncE